MVSGLAGSVDVVEGGMPSIRFASSLRAVIRFRGMAVSCQTAGASCLWLMQRRSRRRHATKQVGRSVGERDVIGPPRLTRDGRVAYFRGVSPRPDVLDGDAQVDHPCDGRRSAGRKFTTKLPVSPPDGGGHAPETAARSPIAGVVAGVRCDGLDHLEGLLFPASRTDPLVGDCLAGRQGPRLKPPNVCCPSREPAGPPCLATHPPRVWGAWVSPSSQRMTHSCQ